MSNQRLSAHDLHVFRGERHVLRGLSLEACGGEYLEVRGSNGAGKTSLLRTLVGLVHAESGEVRWRGQDIREDRCAFHRELAYLGHDAPLKADLDAYENLWFATGLRRAVTRAEVAAALDRTGARAYADQPARTLSAGQRRRVALAALLLSGAPLWVLDEPATNLDADGQRVVAALIDGQLAGGGLVIAAVHSALPISVPGVRHLELRAT